MKYRKLIKQLNNLQLFRIFIERRNKTVRIKTKKKAFVSVLLSFVMIMGLFFVPKVNAEEQPDQPNTISFKQVEKDMDMVGGIILRIDGNDQEIPISYPAGLISGNIGSLPLSENQKFQKAVVRSSNNGQITETEIARIGTYEEKIYYSLTNQQDIGITLKEGQDIVFICSTQYTVTYQPNDYGTITGPETILNGENLNITVKANDYYHIESVTMNGENLSLSSENSKNESIQIESSQIKENVTINATFVEDNKYRIIEKNAWIGDDGQYHGYTDEDVPKGGIQQGDICWNDDDEVIGDVSPGNPITFWLYSKSNSGGSMWRLNMLKFNDENINVPLKYDKNAKAQTTLSNGSIVTITLIKDDHKIGWKDEWYDLSTKRTIYEVHIDHVKESIDISGNFKDASKSEIMLTGLEGIETSGMVKEASGKYKLVDNDVHFYYDFQNEDGDKVYDAYYTDEGSYNIILYSVKPGYNPYTLNLSAIYDGNPVSNIDTILQSNSNLTNYDIDYIANFIANHPENRHFGIVSYDDLGRLEVKEPSTKEQWIVDAESFGHTHGIILKQNEAKNQIININANPYQYNLIFDLTGGNGLDSSKYQQQADNYVEINSEGKIITYTLKDGSTNAYMPIQNPTRAGHVFLGWQLYNGDEKVEDINLLTSNQAFTIDENTINYSNGDSQKDTGHTFTFKAVWATETQSADDAIYTIDVYYEQPNGQYEIKQSISDIGTVGEELNYVSDKDKYNPNTNLYYLNENSPKSKLTINQLLDDDIEINPNYKENNTIKLYYSYYRYDLTVTKDAIGDYADLSRDWTIDVTLTNENDADLSNKTFICNNETVTLNDGNACLSLKDGESFTFTGLIKGTLFTIKETNQSNDYTISYNIKENSNDTGNSSEEIKEQSLSSNKIVTVINTMKNINIPGTNIPTSGMNNTITMLGIGSIGIIGIVALLWYWRKKHV